MQHAVSAQAEEIDCTISMERANLLVILIAAPLAGLFAGSFIVLWDGRR